MHDFDTPQLEEREEHEESPFEQEEETVAEKPTLLQSEVGAYKEIISNLKQVTRNDLAAQLYFVHETLKKRGQARNGNDGHGEEKDTKTPSRYWAVWPTKESTFLEPNSPITGAFRFRQEAAALAVRIASHKLQAMKKVPSSEEYPNPMSLRRLAAMLQRKLECLLDAVDSFRQQQRSRLMQERLVHMDWQVVYGLAKLTQGAFSSTKQDTIALEKATEQCRRVFNANLSQVKYSIDNDPGCSISNEPPPLEDEAMVQRILNTIEEQVHSPEEHHQ
ncbi:RNA polymerase I upstream activation factor complex subunit Acr1 [Schizosaccharomyces osmophilus]|uniref:RNA polymerase I upstream activation factor complex subunit Acr1 n=1 Tax=Schizosaccharomyces osmophilus TaxID=2545709 RepID=A0AAE9WAG9_9SCHI|nr:RNA polymerase I upstream activation factor complex subunit Acr1 [Schizosaccharomyces osmophilus]WBW71667.1 RNA polymerase I upstream activation factor complex subunit Acr1 [Schizosaccharomyces osmophilus]